MLLFLRKNFSHQDENFFQNCKLNSNISQILLISLLLIAQFRIPSTEAAKYCMSGRNGNYSPKQCSVGSTPMEFTCQKFTCEGGKSPFTLRTCAMKSSGCLAGPRICAFSGGKGSCSRCDSDKCNS